MGTPTNISVLILALNEETNLPAALESVRWSDDVHVIDSGSTDATVEIARRFGAQVYLHPFENYSAQRNWALENVPFRHKWFFFLDADEWVPADLAAEMKAVAAAAPPDLNAFFVSRQVIFLGRAIPRAGEFRRVWIPRLFRRGTIRYEDRVINEHPHMKGKAAYLKAPLLHENCKGIADLIAKYDSYATLEAQEALRLLEGHNPDFPGRWRGGPANRRRWLKQIHLRLPLRGARKFFYLFLWRRAFLDGVPGFLFVSFMAVQEWLLSLKLGALKRRLPVGR